MAKKEFLQSQQILKRCFNNVTGKLKSNGGTYTTQDYLNAVYDESKDSLRIVVQGGGSGGNGGVSYWGSLVYDETQLPQKEKQGTITPVIKNDTLSFYYYDGKEWKMLLQSAPTYDDTQIRDLISQETEERKTALQQITSGVEELSEQIDKLKKITDIEEYTAVEVFPHNFTIKETGGSVVNGQAKTVGEMFTQWQELGSTNVKYVQTSNVGNLNDAYSYRISGKPYYKRFHPTMGYIDVELQELTELPEVGQINVLYKVGKKYYFYYDEYFRNLRKHLTTAKDSDVFFKFGSGYEIIIKLRTRLTEEQVKSGKSNVVLDWGDGNQTLFKDGVKSGNNYEFQHIYEKQFWNKNLILKVYGNDYYMMQFSDRYSNSQTTQVIVTRAMDYDLPVAEHLKIFANFMQNNMVYRVDARRCNRSFEGCNIASMFTTKTIQEVIGFNDDANETAFNSIYCMNYMFNGVITLKNIDLKFPSMCKLPYYQYVFNNVYFNYGGEPYDILNLFNNFSFSSMPENESVDVAGMFNNCKNITCSDYQKLGSYLWNNINVNWKNTSGVFKGCPQNLRANIPVEWGGTLVGWIKPEKLSKQYVDSKDVQIQKALQNIEQKVYQLQIEKSDEYTAFEVFPHNFSFANPTNFSKDTVKTVGEMFEAWQKVTSLSYKERTVGAMNVMYKVSNTEYKRFNPFVGFIDLTIEEVETLPEQGQMNVLYKLGADYYLYYSEEMRNLRKGLTTAKDDDIFFGMDASNKLVIRLRTRLTLQEVDADKSDVVIDWGDGTQTKFKDYNSNVSWFDFEHEYSDEYMNKNCIVKILGKDYYMFTFKSTTTSIDGNGVVIVTRMMDYDLPIASHLCAFSNINANNLVYRIDARKCNRSFEGNNLASMFTSPNIQQIKGFDDDSRENAFNSIYCMNYMFNGVKHIKSISLKFPALCKLPYYQYVFNGVYFNYGGEPYDILKLFNNFSFSLMPQNESVDVAGMFNNCKNITCSDYQKLGSYLWNNININWKNTSGVFKGCPQDLRVNIPVEWGGLLQGWKKPENNGSSLTEEQKEFVDWGVENKNTLEYFVANKQKIQKLLAEQFAVKTFVMTLPKLTGNEENITAVNIDVNGIIKDIVDGDNFDGDETTHYRIDVQGYVVGLQTYENSNSIIPDRYYTKQVYEESNGNGMTHIYLTKQEYDYFSSLQNGKNIIRVHYLNLTIGNGTLLRKIETYVPGVMQVGVKFENGDIIQTNVQSQITHYRYRINGYVMSIQSFASNESQQADQVIPFATSYIENQNGGVGYTDIYFTKQGLKEIAELNSPKNVIEFYYLYQIS